VFLSYASEDRPAVEVIHAGLKAAGLRVIKDRSINNCPDVVRVDWSSRVMGACGFAVRRAILPRLRKRKRQEQFIN
jgi:hypothetical protein